MTTTRVTSTDFQRDYALLSDKARREPVVVPADESARLNRRDRMVGSAADFPDGWLDAVLNAGVSAGHDNLTAAWLMTDSDPECRVSPVSKGPRPLAGFRAEH